MIHLSNSRHFTSGRTRAFRNIALALAAAFLPLCPAGRAQVAPPPQQEQAPIVRDIEIQYAGPSTISRERILANMHTAIGKPYSQTAVEDDIRSLYATGSVVNVRIFGEPVQNGVKVVVVLQSKASVSAINIVGATAISVKKLRKDISTKPGQTLNEANIEQDRQKILQEYADRNFSGTQVTEHTDVDDRTGAATVTFTINEGGKTIVKAIRFEGNTAFTQKELRKVVKTKPANVLSFITKDGRVNPETLDADVTALREFYQNHGYEDVVVQSPRIDEVGRSRVALVYPIQEGIQYHNGPVTVSGAQVFTIDQIRALLKAKPGGVFSPQDLRDDTKAVGDLYGSRGYIDLSVTAETASAGPALISINYKIDEGTQSYIDRINIEGNARTKDKVIRRELAVAPGDVYNSVLIETSRERLLNLNYFNKKAVQGGVQIFPGDTGIPGRKDVNVRLEEAPTGTFNFGAGFSSIDSLLGFVEVQQTNFDLMNWRNGFTGGGERFRTRIQYGTQRKDFDLSLTEPYFLDYQLSLGGELFYNDASYVSSVYNQRDYGFDLSARKPINAFTSARLDYRIEEIELYGFNSGVSDTLLRDSGSHLKSSITAGITNDTRDSVFLSRKGHRVDFSTFVAGGPLGGNVNEWGFDANGSQYYHFPGDGILSFNAELADTENFGSSDHVPVFDRLYLGGPNSLRGFRFRDVAPHDDKGQPVGGDSLGRVSVEYTFPIIDRVRGAGFYDIGFVNPGAFNLSLGNLGSDAGLGLRLDLPIGPVRLDYGIPIQNPYHSSSSGQFNFSIGYQF